MTLAESPDGKKALSVLLFEQFDLLNVWGKSPDALKSIARSFAGHLADYPLEKIIAAFRLHASRSADFPTPSDIIGLIRRGGKPPYERVVYTNISKKHPADRSADEWDYMRGFEAEQMGGEATLDSPGDYDRLKEENARLRGELAEARRENMKLDGLLRDSRRDFKPPQPTFREKIERTVADMKARGASEADIQEFMQSTQGGSNG